MFPDLPGFFFTGALLLPGFVTYAGDYGLAMMAMIFLLLAGCLSAMADPSAPFRRAERAASESAPREE
jgi:hypothetical protein